MGASQLKQYNLKQPLINLPGGYSFIKVSKGIHPQNKNNISIFIIKKPHKILNPSVESEFIYFNEIKERDQYIVAISQQQIQPLVMTSYQKNDIQFKIIFKLFIQKPAQLGRYFFTKGKIKLWCEQKRGLQSLSPQEVLQNRSYENSKIFCSAIAFLNFLMYCIQKSKTGFFEPKNKQQYLKNLEDILIRIETTDIWHYLNSSLKDLIKRMIDPDPKTRITYKQLIKAQYLQDPVINTYYDLCQLYHFTLDKQIQFLKCLQKSLYLFETFLIKKFIIPILVNYLKISTISHLVVLCLVEALNRSNLIQTQYFDAIILANLVKLLKNNPTLNTIFNLLMKAQHWSNYMSMKQFEQYFVTMLLKSYESKNSNLLILAIQKTQFFLDRLSEITYKNELQNQLLGLIGNTIQQNVKLTALKCIYTLLKNKKLTNLTKINKNLMNIQSQNTKIKLHILKIYSILIQEFPPQQLMQTFTNNLAKHLNVNANRKQFEYSYELYHRILQRIHDWYSQSKSTRKIQKGDDEYQIENQQNFMLTKQMSNFELVTEEQQSIEFNYFKSFHKQKKFQENINGIEIQKIGEDQQYKVSEDFGKIEQNEEKIENQQENEDQVNHNNY